MFKNVFINGFKIYPFRSKNHFLCYLREGNWNNILVALNAEKLIKSDGELKKIVNNNIGFPDGVGAVLALKRKRKEAVKIAGTEFWLDIVQEFYTRKSFYLIGGQPAVMERTVAKLKKQFPGIEISGCNDGYFSDSEYRDIVDDIARKKPDIVFVAMGSPRQEFIMREFQKRHEALYMGLGGSFDVYTGNVKRAPKFWIDNHLEWAYRLMKQPRRAFRQIYLVKFLYLFFFNKL